MIIGKKTKETISTNETSPQKKALLLSPIIGDWTTYKPQRIISKKVRSGLYNFDRISEESLQKVLLAHYKFISKLLKALKIDLKLIGELHSVTAEQSTYLKFINNINRPQLDIHLKIPGLIDPIYFWSDLGIVNTIINHSLGTKDANPLSRGLTESEEKVISTIYQEYFNQYFTDTFLKVFNNPKLEIASSPNITLDQSTNPNSTFIVITFEIAFGENSPLKLHLAYPGAIMQSLAEKYKEKINSSPLNLSKLPISLLNKIEIPIKVSIGETWTSSQDLYNLENGDVVELNNTIDHAIHMTIGENLTFLVQPGKNGKKLSVRIIGLKRDEKIKIDTPIIEDNEEISETEESMEEELDETESEIDQESAEENVDETQEESFEEETSENDVEPEDPKPAPIIETARAATSNPPSAPVDLANDVNEEANFKDDLGDDLDLNLDDFSGEEEFPPPPSFK